MISLIHHSYADVVPIKELLWSILFLYLLNFVLYKINNLHVKFTNKVDKI